jgi:hypothetical protein
MKLALLSVTIGAATAFAPSASNMAITSLSMSDSVSETPEEG